MAMDPNQLTPNQKIGMRVIANLMAQRKMARQHGLPVPAFPKPTPGGLPNPGQVPPPVTAQTLPGGPPNPGTNPPPVQAQVPPNGPNGAPSPYRPGLPGTPVSANSLTPAQVNQIAAMMASRGRGVPTTGAS